MMECKDIQEKLSDYIDDVIDSQEKMLIDKHLISCQRCRESLSELKKTVEYLKKLEEVEPPSWLSQKVMAKIKKEAEPKKGFLQRLFYPLYIKLPIEAVAAIFIAVAAVYLYQAIEPQKRLTEAPTELIARNEVSRSPEQSEGDKAISEPKPAVPLAQEDKKDKGGQKGDLKEEKAAQPAGASVKEEMRQRPAAEEPKLKRTLADKKEGVINITISFKNIETANKEIERIIVQLKGRIIKKGSSENKNLLTAEIDAKKVDDLSEKLKLIGKVKEKILNLEAQEGNVEINIEIVKTSHP